MGFSYTPLAVICGEFLLHAPCCFMWGVSLTRPLLFYVGSLTPHWSKTLRKNQSQWKRETTAARSVRLQRGTPCIHSCTRHRLWWYQDGKHGPIGTQRPLTHRIWLRLNIASHGSEQTGPFPYICLKLWAQEICVVCTFQCPNIAMPRTTLGLCTASWPNLIIQSVVGISSYTPKLVLWAGFSYTCHIYATFWENVSLTRPVLASPKSYIHASSN